ncbi:MAG: phage tail tip lysozyme, partial [Stellaceae bacterium]
ASHVLVATKAQQFDPVVAKDLPGQTLGILFGWTDLTKGVTTTDAALVQVDPALVSPELGPLGLPKGTNLDPRIGARLSIFAAGQVRSGVIREIGVDRAVEVVGPDFTGSKTYLNQIRCDNFSLPGCSGAIAIDDDGKVVGMVVAGDGSTFTLVTPIDAVLANPDFTDSGRGPPLEVQATIPPTAKTFPHTPPVPRDPGTEPGRAQAALAFFQTRGWSRAQAIGLIANIHAESSFNPHVQPGDGGISFGLCQWNGNRLTNFINHVGHDITNSTFNEQLDFIDFELHTEHQEKPAGDLLRQAATPAAAASVVCINYERPKNLAKDAAERENIARVFDQTGTFPPT